MKAFFLLDLTRMNISEEQPEADLKFYENRPSFTSLRAYPAPYFILAEINLSSLRLALQKLKQSIWWNVHGFFMIQKTEPGSCKEAHDYLKIVWTFNILFAALSCMDSENRSTIFTFNPYLNYAPKIWDEYQSVQQSNGRSLFIFKLNDTTDANCKLLIIGTVTYLSFLIIDDYFNFLNIFYFQTITLEFVKICILTSLDC